MKRQRREYGNDTPPAYVLHKPLAGLGRSTSIVATRDMDAWAMRTRECANSSRQACAQMNAPSLTDLVIAGDAEKLEGGGVGVDACSITMRDFLVLVVVQIEQFRSDELLHEQVRRPSDGAQVFCKRKR